MTLDYDGVTRKGFPGLTCWPSIRVWSRSSSHWGKYCCVCTGTSQRTVCDVNQSNLSRPLRGSWHLSDNCSNRWQISSSRLLPLTPRAHFGCSCGKMSTKVTKQLGPNATISNDISLQGTWRYTVYSMWERACLFIHRQIEEEMSSQISWHYGESKQSHDADLRRHSILPSDVKGYIDASQL